MERARGAGIIGEGQLRPAAGGRTPGGCRCGRAVQRTGAETAERVSTPDAYARAEGSGAGSERTLGSVQVGARGREGKDPQLPGLREKSRQENFGESGMEQAPGFEAESDKQEEARTERGEPCETSPTGSVTDNEAAVTDNILFRRGNTLVRLRLSGETILWRRDPTQRIAAVLSTDLLSIEHRGGVERHLAQIMPGQVDWRGTNRTVGASQSKFQIDRGLPASTTA